MKILFMGTPDFALVSLKALCEAGHEIVTVITQPDKPKGRGHHMMPPPVKVYAMEQGINVLQPLTLRGEEFAQTLENIAPELIVVVAYGRILPKNVLDYPKYGCVNVHGSLLPEYRGAAPMQRAIIDGKKITGITTMLMAEGLDTGDMLLKAEMPIDENDNFETVHDKLAAIGASLLLETVRGLESGSITPTPQGEGATYAAKIEKGDCLIDFSKTADEVHNLIRGLSPIPLSFTHTPDGKLLKITESRVYSREKTEFKPGEVISLDGEIRVACGEGIISLRGVVPEGKSKMRAADFINGRKISVGDLLS
ncbi:MAG: methionyl-tRNA formyltransferase [Ruminococcaceae bacterium]|nr:methionyl-tRNA formyltransferase [Oscillospiraceae bacterium]